MATTSIMRSKNSRVGVAAAQLGEDLAVANKQHTARVAGGKAVVRNHEHGGAQAAVKGL